MKGKAKVISLLLAAAMTAGLFAGCNNGGGGSTSSTGSTGSTGSTASTASTGGSDAPSGEITEVNWNIWASGEPTAAAEVIAELNKKSEADIGVRINFLWTIGSSDSVSTAMQAGDKNLDIAFCCNWWADYPGSAQMGYMADLTDLLPEVTPTLYNKLPSLLWDGVKVNGRIYGVPTWKDAAAEIFWMGRKDVVEGADCLTEFNAANEDFSTLTPVLEKVKAWHDADPTTNAYAEGTDAPFYMNKGGINPMTPNWDMGVSSPPIGVKIGDDSATVIWAYDDPDLIKNCHTLKDWADRGLSNGKSAAQVEQEPQTINIWCGQGWEGAQYTAWGGPNKGYDTLISSRSGPFLTSAYVQGGVNIIGANSSKVEPALKYLEYVNTNEEYRNMMAYGVEGVTYKVAGTTADGKPIVDRTELGTGWTTANFTVGTMDLLWPDSNLPESQYDVNARICDMVNHAEASPLMGFVLDTSKVKNQIAACDSIWKEYDGMLRRGDANDVDATIAEAKSRLLEVGLQDIIDEYQKQANAFLGK